MVSNVQVVNGTTTQYTYDDDRNVKSEVVNVDTGRTTTTEYETNYLGKVEYKTTSVRKGDIYGNNFDTDNDNIYVSTKYDYDVEGNLKTTTGPLLRTTVGDVNSYSSVNGTYTTTYYYDAMNRSTGVTQPGIDETGAAVNITTTTVYNWEGKPVITTDPNGDTTEYEYNQMGLLSRMKKGNEIIGVTDSGFAITGTWTDGTVGGYRCGTVKYTSTSGSTANWSKTINKTGTYDVYVKCPEVEDGSTSATYKVYDGSTLRGTVTLNQYTNRGNWVKLGRYVLTSDLIGKVSLTTGSSKTYADAVKFENINMNITAYKYDLAGRLTAQVNPKDYTDGASIDTMNRTVFTYDGMGRMKTTGFKGFEKQIDPATTGWKSSTVAIDITTKSVDYDGNGNVIKETDGVASSTEYKYTPANQLERVLEPELKNDYPSANIENLYSAAYEYDTLDRKVLESNIKGYLTSKYYIKTWYKYDDSANTILVKTAKNSSNIEAEAIPMRKEFYDFVGNIKSVMDANNVAKTTGAKTVDYVFNSFNESKSVNYPGDYEADVTGSTLPVRKVNYQYDYFGNLKKEFETYKMKVKTNVSTYTSITNVKEYTYDNQARLLLKEEYQSDNKAGTLIQNSFKYDRNGNKRFETDGNTNTTQYSYDWFGRVINKSISYTDSTTTPARTVILSTLYTYDANGNVTAETNKVAASTNSSISTYTYDYDSQNRLIEKQDQGIVVQRLEYYNNGLQKSSYDAVNSATGTKLRLTSFAYDKNGKLKSTTDPVNTADTSYPNNHLTSSTTNTYDYVGNTIEVKDGNGNVTQYSYDGFDRLTEVKNKDINEKYKYDYDSNGNMTKQTALYLVSGVYTAYRTMDYKYNDGNLLTERKTQPGNTDKYSYYADGTVKEKTDRNAAKTSYVYDIHGRLVLQKTEKTGATAVNVEYTYDNNGNQLQMIDSTGTTIRTYDAMNRVLTKQVPNVGVVKYIYDILSTRTEFAGLTAETCEYPLCTNNTVTNKTTKVYDKSNRLKYVVDGDTTGTIIATYTYNNDGSRRSLVYGNNYKEEYVYWEDSNLKSLTNKKADGTSLDIYKYQYDGAHNQIRKYEYINGAPKGTTIYAYDKMNRMNKVTEPSGKITDYTFDPAGNRKTEVLTEGTKVTTNTYNYSTEDLLQNIVTVVKVNGAITENHSSVYTNDANGNRLTVTYDGTLQNSYVYDLINRMITVKNSGGTVIANYSYNGEGQRVGKVGTSTTRYLYEYDKVILEVDGSNNQVARNIYGTNLLMRTMNDQVPAGQTFYYMYNGHGDVTAFLNRDTGKLAATYYYDAFGNINNEQHYDVNGNPTTVKYNNSILYAGYQYDKESGLYYLNARMYDPKIARFMQEDTYTGDPNDPLSLNLYTYCHNEPIRYTDPSGHKELEDYLYLPNDAIMQIEKFTSDYESAGINSSQVPYASRQKVIAELKQRARNGADAVRTFYALYYPKDSEKFKKYYKFGQTKDNGFIFMPKYSTSSRVLYLNDKIVDAEVAASDPAIKKYFLDNYIGNWMQPTNTLFATWRHQFYGYTADEIKNAKFSDGLEQTFFGTVQVGADVITIVYTGGLATVPAAYSAIDGVSSIAGGISQMVNAGNDKGETWNFKRNFYNFIGKENGDKLYKADQTISGIIGLAGFASMKFGKIKIEAPNFKSKRGAVLIPGPKDSWYKGMLSQKASDMKALIMSNKKGNRTNAWTKAVEAAKEAISNGEKFQVRVKSSTEAKQFLTDILDGRGINRYKAQTNARRSGADKYKKGYEQHIDIEAGSGDMPHIKFYINGTDGHIFYEIPN